MTNKQESHLNMYLSVRDFLNQNATLVGALPNFPATVTTFQNSITQIQQTAELQEIDKSGIVTNKKQLRATLVTQAVDVARRVAAYATFVNNSTLLQEVNYTESDLNKSSDEKLKNRTQIIYDRANTNLAALATYGVTAPILTALLNDITAYNTAIPKPRLGITETKQATDQLALLFDGAESSLNKIDMLIETLRISQPNFYVGYSEVRMIVNTGIGSIALKALATEIGTAIPIKGVTFSFVPDMKLMKAVNGNGHSQIVKITADKGMFHIKHMPEGTYQVTVTKPGYKDKVVTVSVANGEMTELDVELEKI